MLSGTASVGQNYRLWHLRESLPENRPSVVPVAARLHRRHQTSPCLSAHASRSMAPGRRRSIGSRIAFVHTVLESKGEAWEGINKGLTPKLDAVCTLKYITFGRRKYRTRIERKNRSGKSRRRKQAKCSNCWSRKRKIAGQHATYTSGRDNTKKTHERLRTRSQRAYRGQAKSRRGDHARQPESHINKAETCRMYF